MDEQVRINKNTFKQIFRDWWDIFLEKYPEYITVNEVVQKMLGCGDPTNGFTTYVCPRCGYEKKVAFSCKSPFCLSCARAYVDNWVEQVKSALFAGVKYKHAVLTIPEDLRKYFHERELLDELIKCGIAALNDVISCCKHKDIELGYIVVLQTAGRAGNWNPHLHIIMTAGGLDENNKWYDINYIPFDVLHKKWQNHLFNMIKEKLSDTPGVAELIDKLWYKYPSGIVAFIHKKPIPTIERLAKYLAKYVVSPPIAISRIMDYNGRTVKYWYNDHKTGKKEEVEVPVMEFIRRMVQHIPPKGFKRIRYYGLHATCKANKVKELLKSIIKTLSEITDLITKPKKWRFRERVIKTYNRDPLTCDKCGCEMILWEIWHPEYGLICSVEEEAKRYFGDHEKQTHEWRRDKLQLPLFPMWA